MNKILFTVLLILASASAQLPEFVSPVEFDGSDEQKAQVSLYIQNTIMHKYCDNDDEDDDNACHPVVIDIEQKENFKAFLALVAVKNKTYLNKLISEHCHIDFFQCSYDNLLHIYEDNLWCDSGLFNFRKKYIYSKL